jgi:hypothetical protein
MVKGLHLVDNGMSTQDRDLLTRLTQYFEGLEQRLAFGQGWFIFNAGGGRAGWIGRFIQARLQEYRPLVSFFVMPWRDFALNAYVTEVELPAQAEARPASAGAEQHDRLQREYRLATGVSRATGYQMRHCDMLVVLGLRPTQRHELAFLDATIGHRHAQRRATILLAPQAPHELAATFAAIEGGAAIWERLWAGMYERSLVAL